MLRIHIRHQLAHLQFAVDIDTDAPVTALFGRSGAGKSSIVNMVAGLLTPDAGRIEIAGRCLFDREGRVNVPVHQRAVGYVFQSGLLFPHLSVQANLRYGSKRRQQNVTTAGLNGMTFEHVVEVFELQPLLQRRPATLSGGEQRRVALGRALLSRPDLLLLDEPLTGLDGGLKDEILYFIDQLVTRFSVPVLFVSHQIDEIVRLADTVALISHGKSEAVGPVEDIMSRLDLGPLTGRWEAGAVLPTHIIGHDDQDQLTELQIEPTSDPANEHPPLTLWVNRIHRPIGTPVRVRIRARDVSIALQRPDDASILNIFSGTLMQLADDGGSQVDCLIDIGRPLRARVTRRSSRQLQLEAGKKVFVLIKSVAVDNRSLGRLGQSPRH